MRLIVALFTCKAQESPRSLKMYQKKPLVALIEEVKQTTLCLHGERRDTTPPPEHGHPLGMGT